MNILLIDDDPDIKSRFDDAILLWNGKHNSEAHFEVDWIPDFMKAEELLRNGNLSLYDGIVVDLISDTEIKGEGLLDILNGKLIRVPVVVRTATSDSVENIPCVHIFKKSESTVDAVLDWFCLVKQSGIVSVMGMGGELEQKLKTIFDQFQTYCVERWALLCKTKGFAVAQRSASRHVLMQLLDALDCGDESVYPDEMYLRVDGTGSLRTGDVIRRDSLYYVVMSPACDLVLHDVSPKSDSVLLVRMMSIKDVFARDLSKKVEKWKEQRKTEQEITALEKNFWDNKKKERADRKGHYDYLHPIPSVQGVDRQYIAFRHVLSVPYKDVLSQYVRTGMRFAPPFLKDIQSRFAAYYGRQGHPDVDFELEHQET